MAKKSGTRSFPCSMPHTWRGQVTVCRAATKWHTSHWWSSLFVVCRTSMTLSLCSTGTLLWWGHGSHIQSQLAGADLQKRTTITVLLSCNYYCTVSPAEICPVHLGFCLQNHVRASTFLACSWTDLTSNKYNSSIHQHLLVVQTVNVGPRSAWRLLVEHRSSVGPPADQLRDQRCVANVHWAKALFLFHNAAKRGVIPDRHHFVLGVHLSHHVGGQIFSWSGQRRKSVENT